MVEKPGLYYSNVLWTPVNKTLISLVSLLSLTLDFKKVNIK